WAEVMKWFGITEAPPPSASRLPPSASRLSGSEELSRLQLRQQPVHFLLLLHRGEAVVHVVGGHLGPGLADRLGAGDPLLHAIEGVRSGAGVERHLRLARLLRDAGAAMPGDQEIALRLRLG